MFFARFIAEMHRIVAILKKLAKNDYELAIERTILFHKAYQKYWMFEKKPHGFELQDIRIGGLLQRLKSCKERILAFTEGEIDRIAELEEMIAALPQGNITYKKINGKEQPYLQWTEKGKSKSKYIKVSVGISKDS